MSSKLLSNKLQYPFYFIANRDIQDLNNIPLQINEFEEGYKEKVGLSGQANNGLPFHPKALEVELQDMRVKH